MMKTRSPNSWLYSCRQTGGMCLAPGLSRIWIHLQETPPMTSASDLSFLFNVSFFFYGRLFPRLCSLSSYTPSLLTFTSPLTWIPPSFVLLFMWFLRTLPFAALPPHLWPVVGLSVQWLPTVGLGWLSTLPLITPQEFLIYLPGKWNRSGERPDDIMLIHTL